MSKLWTPVINGILYTFPGVLSHGHLRFYTSDTELLLLLPRGLFRPVSLPSSCSNTHGGVAGPSCLQSFCLSCSQLARSLTRDKGLLLRPCSALALPSLFSLLPRWVKATVPIVAVRHYTISSSHPTVYKFQSLILFHEAEDVGRYVYLFVGWCAVY